MLSKATGVAQTAQTFVYTLEPCPPAALNCDRMETPRFSANYGVCSWEY